MFLLGDFNACVGSREGNDDPWWYERGPYGHGILNDAGRELLSFLSINGSTVCNTWFTNSYKQHLKCIDYVVMRKSDHWRCLDARIMRGAQCNMYRSYYVAQSESKIGKKPST